MSIARRSFLLGAATLLAAPSIVRAASLMPVVPVAALPDVYPAFYGMSLADIEGRRIANLIEAMNELRAVMIEKGLIIGGTEPRLAT